MMNCKRLFAGLALIAAASVAMTATAAAQNLLINPDIETGDTTGWEIFGEGPNSVASVVLENGPAAPGIYAVDLDNQAEGLALVLKQSSAAGSAAAGDVQYSIDLKVLAAGVGGVSFLQIFAEQPNGGVIGGSGLLGPFFNANWANISGSFTAPAGTDFLTIQVEATTGAVTGSTFHLLVDNASLMQDSVVPVENTSFGQIKALYN